MLIRLTHKHNPAQTTFSISYRDKTVLLQLPYIAGSMLADHAEHFAMTRGKDRKDTKLKSRYLTSNKFRDLIVGATEPCNGTLICGGKTTKFRVSHRHHEVSQAKEIVDDSLYSLNKFPYYADVIPKVRARLAEVEDVPETVTVYTVNELAKAIIGELNAR